MVLDLICLFMFCFDWLDLIVNLVIR